jgi:hypothetical protein
MIFTKPDREKIITRRMPAVLHSCWRAADGRRLLVLVNHTGERQNFRFEGDGLRLGGRIERRRCMAVTY